MKAINKIIVIIVISNLFLVSLFPKVSYALSTRGHIIEAGKSVTDAVVAPLKGLFYVGPKHIRDAYQYEVYGREKEEKRGLLRYKLFALWRAPGEEAKAVIDGCVESVESLGAATKNIISIFFSD